MERRVRVSAVTDTRDRDDTSALVRIERAVRQLWTNPNEQHEVLAAYQAVARIGYRDFGRRHTNQVLHAWADQLERRLRTP